MGQLNDIKTWLKNREFPYYECDILEDFENICISKEKMQDKEIVYNPITNFLIYPLYCVEHYTKLETRKKQLEYHVILFSKNKYKKVIFKTGDFVSKKAFKERLNEDSIDFKYVGTDNDLENLKGIISNLTTEKCFGIDKIGLFDFENTIYYIDKNGCFGCNNETLEIEKTNKFILYDDIQVNVNYDLTADINKEDFKEFSKHLFNFNAPELTYTIISTIAAFFFKEKSFKFLGLKMPHLGIFGESGSGKSETIDFIIKAFYPNRASDFCGSIKQFALLKKLSESSIVPVILEEYKEGKLGKFLINLIGNTIRSCFDRHSIERGHADQTTTLYELLAPIILAGETIPNEKAILERTNITVFSQNYHTPERLNSLKYLKTRPELFLNLSIILVKEVIKITKDEMLSYLSETDLVLNEIIKNLDVNIPSRIRTNINSTCFGYTILFKIFDNMGIKLEKLEVAYKYIIKNQVEELLNHKSKSIVDNSLEYFKIMADNNFLIEKYDYLIEKNNIYLRLQSIYPKFTKYIRDFNISDEVCISKNDFMAQVKKTKYFVKNSVNKKGFLKVPEIDPPDNAKTTNQRALMLDLEIISKKDIEFFGLTPYAVENENDLPLKEDTKLTDLQVGDKSGIIKTKKFDLKNSSRSDVKGWIFVNDKGNVYIPPFSKETQIECINNLSIKHEGKVEKWFEIGDNFRTTFLERQNFKIDI